MKAADRLATGLTQLRGYRAAWWRGDVLAGITVAAYLVPQVMAYSGLAGLPPIAGLWATLPALAVYAFLDPHATSPWDRSRPPRSWPPRSSLRSQPDRARAAVDGQHGPVEWFVLNTEANVEVDITGLDALEQLRAELTAKGITFALARVKQDLLDDLRAFGLADRIGTDLIFPTLPTVVAAFHRRPPGPSTCRRL